MTSPTRMTGQPAVGYEVRIYVGGSLRDIEMFRSAIDAQTYADLIERRLGTATVGIVLHAIGRATDGTLYVLANLSR